MRNRPLKGSLSSRIKKVALATENAPTSTAATLVAFSRERIPKPQNSNIAQETTTPSSGHDTGRVRFNVVGIRLAIRQPEDLHPWRR